MAKLETDYRRRCRIAEKQLKYAREEAKLLWGHISKIADECGSAEILAARWRRIAFEVAKGDTELPSCHTPEDYLFPWEL